MSTGMRIGIMIARVLLGLPFVVFGLNNVFHFLPMPPLEGPAGAFAGAMMATGYFMQFTGAMQALGGALVLSGRLLPVGLLVLVPIIVNIDLFHVFLDPKGAGMGLFMTVLGLVLAWAHRECFRPLFSANLK